MIAINISDAAPRREDVRHVLRLRILTLIANHPEILELQGEKLTTVILLEFPEFEFLDLNPTFAEMCSAFHSAVQIMKAQKP